MGARKRLLQLASAGCVCYLPMWEGAGARVEDVSLANNHGAITGASWTTSGELRNGLSFDGNDYVDCGHDASLEPAAITVSVWVKPTSSAPALDAREAVDKSSWDVYGYGILWYNDGFADYWKAYIGDGTSAIYIGGAAPTLVTLNAWQCITLVVESNGDCYLYKNGVLAISDTTSLTQLAHATAYNLTVGKLAWADARYAIGIIDEVRVWNRALSATEIALDYYRTCRGSY